jgi:hypothetical protein
VLVILSTVQESKESINSLDGIGVASDCRSLCSNLLSLVVLYDHDIGLISLPKLVDQTLALLSVHLGG